MVELACFLEDHYVNLFSANLEIQMDSYFHCAFTFGINKVKIIDLTQQKFGKYYLYNTSEIIIEHYDGFYEFCQQHEQYNKEMIFILQNIDDYSSISYVQLFDFTHPEDCLYVIQPNFTILDFHDQNMFRFVRPLNKRCFLFAQQYLTIVLYDRFIKLLS